MTAPSSAGSPLPDRAAADENTEKFPGVAQIAQANRAFLVRAVRHVARQGIAQFLDLGSGLPTRPNTHEVAWEAAPDARVCYVDNDPVVLAHARALLAIDDKVSVATADIRINPPNLVSADPNWVSVLGWQGGLANQRGIFVDKTECVEAGVELLQKCLREANRE